MLRDGHLSLVSDPFRQPSTALRSLVSSVGSFSDKLRIARLRARVVRTPGRRLLRGPESSTARHLRGLGFSPKIIDRFFRPFFGGVFLERELETSSRWFELLFRQFSLGAATLPARGIRALPEQLAARLPEGAVRLASRVEQVAGDHVVLEGGQRIEATAVVVATEEPAACALLGEPPPERWRAVSALYFDAPSCPIEMPILILNGNTESAAVGARISSVCFPSQVAPSYAPVGRTLVSVTCLGPGEPDVGEVLHELFDWFGGEVSQWRHLETVAVPYALPVQTPGAFLQPKLRPVHSSGVFVAGDHLETASIHGALVSGRRTAEAVVAQLRSASS